MANTNAPNGFSPVRRQDGAQWMASDNVYQIDPTNATPIYYGDVVSMGADGYIVKATAGTVTILGVFIGAEFTPNNNTTNAIVNYHKTWPGSGVAGGSGGTVRAFVIDDPMCVFNVQAGGTAIAFANLFANVQFNNGTPNTATGLSGAYVESPAVTTTLPFRVVGFVESPGIGYDNTSAYNRVYVKMNNQEFNILGGKA